MFKNKQISFYIKRFLKRFDLYLTTELIACSIYAESSMHILTMIVLLIKNA